MTFSDKETKDIFYKCRPLLAVITTHFEWECAKFHGQVVCASADKDSAGLIIKDIKPDHLIEAVNKTNQIFKRKDGRNSCQIESIEHSLAICLGTEKEDLKELL